MSRDPALETFLAEAADLLSTMERVLLQCEQGSQDSEAINELFRAAHTIKGSAGLFGLNAIVEFTHVVESVLDRARMNGLPITAIAAAILLECADHIGTLVGSIGADDETDDPVLIQAGLTILSRLTVETGFESAVTTAEQGRTAALLRKALAETEGVRVATGLWHVSVSFSADVLRNGMDPLSFIRYLSTFGSIDSIEVVSAFPSLDQYDAESCYVGFEIGFSSEADQTRIEEAFEFVRDDCTLKILAMPAASTSLVVEPPGTVIAVEDMAPRQSEGRRSTDAKSDSRSIRVDGDKLDRLIDWIGELIIAGAATGSIARKTGIPVLQESALQLAHIVGEIRDQALKLRMIQIGSTFSRFHRVVRDVAHEIGKDIVLEVTGAETELDRSLVEGIADPLTHLVRNAIDHGIETTALRTARGKSPSGLVRLDAYHDAGSVIIEVSDDGGGLKRDRILQKATERGLISAGESLTDEQVYALIFEPGFSTAEKVTNLSGRGVGMDVVKRNISALRGTVEIHSEEGKGTRICIRLPLTLAIIDGFQVGVGRSHFVIPLDLVEECIDASVGGDTAIAASEGHISLHGSVLPLIRLREMFSIREEPSRRQSVVVVRSAGKRVGIVVDDLLGELQAVIKPLSKLFSELRGIGGSTILGTGKVALILDIPGLVERTQEMRRGSDEMRRTPMRTQELPSSSFLH